MSFQSPNFERNDLSKRNNRYVFSSYSFYFQKVALNFQVTHNFPNFNLHFVFRLEIFFLLFFDMVEKRQRQNENEKKRNRYD